MWRYFGVDDDWVRPAPGPGWWRRDIALATALTLLSAVGIEFLRAASNNPELVHPRWQQYLAVVTAGLLLVWRRQFPVTIMVALTGVHFFVAGTLLPETAVTLGGQILYFMGMLSAFAWARQRTNLLIGASAVILLMAGWLAWALALGNLVDSVSDRPVTGLVAPMLAVVLWNIIINLLYFFGAIAGGQALWSKAKADAMLQEQASQIRDQASQIAEQAVLAERLRIARELHDVVAHHVSLIGVQAAATRRTLSKDPVAASASLEAIERSSRDAVAEMRMLLSALRADDAPDDRFPVPTVTQLPQLIDDVAASGLRVDYSLVDPDDLVTLLPASVSATLFRTVQEALSNVRAHSTAHAARVVVRLAAGSAEAEITDSGRPLVNSAGSGFGIRGITERVAAAGGEAEIGPREHGGFRVRAVLPWRKQP